MNVMSTPLLIVGVLLLASPASWAQSGSMDSDATTSASQSAWSVTDPVFTAEEKRIIGEFFGRGAQQPSEDDGSPPDWAVRGADDGDDDGDDDTDRGQSNGKGKSKGKGQSSGKGKSNGKGKSKQMPPGLAKRDSLPPGLARQLEENGKLPPGLAKRDLPDDLAAQMPKRPEDQDVTIVEDDVVLTDKATGVILDVIKDIVTGGTGAGSDNSTPATDEDAAADDTILDTVLKGIFGGRGTQ